TENDDGVGANTSGAPSSSSASGWLLTLSLVEDGLVVVSVDAGSLLTVSAVEDAKELMPLDAVSLELAALVLGALDAPAVENELESPASSMLLKDFEPQP